MELIKLTHENLDKEHICCAISNNKDTPGGRSLRTAERNSVHKRSYRQQGSGAERSCGMDELCTFL